MRNVVKRAKRIVVKVGTSSLIYQDGGINLSSIDQLAFALTDLNNRGLEVILVSSGAIGVGMKKLHLQNRPETIPEQQAVAAIGQAELINIYNQRFSIYGQTIGQVLLTRDVTEYPESRQNVSNTLEQLLRMKIIPVVNENDTVAVDELDHLTKFGDNDQLSAIVTVVTDADLLIMLSDIDGFFSSDPLIEKQAKLFHEIHQVNADLYKVAGGQGSLLGTGGMHSKLRAVERIFAAKKAMILANGKNPRILFDIIKGEEIGTLFVEDLKM